MLQKSALSSKRMTKDITAAPEQERDSLPWNLTKRRSSIERSVKS